MVYSEARRLRILGIWARTTMMYALERESDHGYSRAESSYRGSNPNTWSNKILQRVAGIPGKCGGNRRKPS
jgi:hypothetical protein